MEKRLFAAIDVGTTTVAVSIINEDNIVIAKDGFLNPEKIFGSDVISRITNSKKADNLIRMKKMMEEAISMMSLVTPWLERIAFAHGVSSLMLQRANSVSADISFCCAAGSPSAFKISCASVILLIATES